MSQGHLVVRQVTETRGQDYGRNVTLFLSYLSLVYAQQPEIIFIMQGIGVYSSWCWRAPGSV